MADDMPYAAATLDYPLAPPAADGSVVEIASDILWARMPMPLALDHINVYLLRGERGWTLVDTGLDTPRARAAWEHIAATHLDGLPLEALICTHWHHDHAGLAHWLCARFDLPLYMTHGEYYVMRAYAAPPPDPMPPEQQRFYRQTGMPVERVAQIFAGVSRDLFTTVAPPSFRRLRGGDEVPIGRRRWRIVIGEGHSPEHACLYDAHEHVLLAGDQLLPRISPNVLITDREPEADPLALWLDSLTRLELLASDTLVLPSHQDVFRGLHVRTRELREHHARQLDVLRGYLREQGSSTAFEAMGRLFPRRRGPIDDLLALGETLAHLSWLRHAGELVRTLDAEDVYRFEACAAMAPAQQAPDL